MSTDDLWDLARLWRNRAARHRREYHAIPDDPAYDGARRDKEALERAHKHCARELEAILREDP